MSGSYIELKITLVTKTDLNICLPGRGHGSEFLTNRLGQIRAEIYPASGVCRIIEMHVHVHVQHQATIDLVS